MTITTKAPRVSYERNRAVWSVDVKGSTDETLYFSVPHSRAGLLSDRADAALLGLLLPAMRTGKDLHVGGPVTDELLHNANGPVQAWVRSVLPMYRPVRVTSDSQEVADHRPAGVATGFSAGVDSFSALGDYLFDDYLPSRMRVTHLLFNGSSQSRV